jgi:hypothetical protein
LEFYSLFLFYSLSTHTSFLLACFRSFQPRISGHFESAISYFWTELTNPRYSVSPFIPLFIQFTFSFIALLSQCPPHAYRSSADHPPPFRLASPTGPETWIEPRQDVSSALLSCAQPPSKWNGGSNNI